MEQQRVQGVGYAAFGARQPVKGWVEGKMCPIERLSPDADFGPSDFRPRTGEWKLHMQRSLE